MSSEAELGLRALVDQILDPTEPATSRIVAIRVARSYLEGITQSVVREARDEGADWQEIADLFVTSVANVKARFGDLRDYD